MTHMINKMVETLGDLSAVDMKVYPTYECKSNCPFCMTDLRWKNTEVLTAEYLSSFRKAFHAYFNAGGRKILFTGGEPTNRPDKLLGMLRVIKDHPLELVVIYTNGVNLLTPFFHDNQTVSLMEALVSEGLMDFNISAHHYDTARRQELSSEEVSDLKKISGKARDIGARIRLNCTLMKDYIGNVSEVMRYIEYARGLGVQDIYFRDLFNLENRRRSCRYANKPKLGFTDSQRVDFNALISEIMSTQNMQFDETISRHRGKGITHIFDYNGGRISFGTLIVGTEKDAEVTYLNFQPDGCAYRDMNGPESKIEI